MHRAGVAGGWWRAAAALALITSIGVTLSSSSAGGQPTATVLWATPLGSGTSCTEAAPCSLLGAQAQARQASPIMTGDVDVELEGGTYDLAHPLTFGPQDSGAHGYQVRYQAASAARPVISGSYPISG